MAPPDIIKEHLSYCPTTGVFQWIKRHGKLNQRYAVRAAGHVDANGYRTIRFKGVLYQAGRLAWWWATGEEPPTVDHKNHSTDDNRLANLRPATKSQNAANRKAVPTGVTRHGRGWKAQIRQDYKNHYLGTFDTKEEASRAYDVAARKHFGEFARRNFEEEKS